MNSNKVIQCLGCGFLLWGFIYSVWLRFPMYPLLLVGICLIIAGTGNEDKHEKLAKKALKTIEDAGSDCPHCPLMRKEGLKQCQECGKNLK